MDAETYARVQQFYAFQMGLMDDREAERWAATFTEDALFQEPRKLEPLHGRAVIEAAARVSADKHAANGLRLRHWLGMLSVDVESDGSLRTRCYAQAIRIPAGGVPDLFATVVCRDHLVPDGAGWLVKHRHLTHDGSDED
ncbi:hydroxylacyl-CoA dehydrogenase [Saccharothrix sp. CB00851]|nr:hydroxylacyl-CoA dehydrogenase [Saccharothrix sp. CB00851]